MALKDNITTNIKNKTAAGSITPTLLGNQLLEIADAIEPEFENATVNTTWDGTPTRFVLTGNTVMTLNAIQNSGFAKVTGNGYSLTINGTSIALKSTGRTIVGYVKDGSEYDFDSNAGSAEAGPDTTPPVIASRTATGPHTIRLVGNESTAFTAAGHSFTQNGSPLTVSAATTINSTTADYTITETLVGGSTILHSYNSGTGSTLDASGNELVSFSNQAVTNSIPVPTLEDLTFAENFFLQNSSGIWTAQTSPQNPAWGNRGADTKKLLSGVDGYVECQKDTDTGLFYLGWYTGTGIPGGFQNFIAAFRVDADGSIQKVDGGNATTGGGTEISVAAAGTIATGEFVRLAVEGSVIKLQKRVDTTVTDIQTFTSTRTVDFRPALDLYGQGFGKIKNPKGYNLS